MMIPSVISHRGGYTYTVVAGSGKRIGNAEHEPRTKTLVRNVFVRRREQTFSKRVLHCVSYEKMKIELSIHASQLKNVAGLGKGTSDPFAVVTRIATVPGEKPQVLGKTEVIKNSLNPDWTKVFVFDYELGTPVKVAVQIFDEVRKGDNKNMGAVVFDIGELLGSRGNTKAKKLKKGGT